MAKVNFNSKHLQKGDPLPHFKFKLRLYNTRYCPFAHRTMLALLAKKIDFEVVNIHLMNKPEWYQTKSVFGRIPSMEVANEVTICESLVTMEYLDDVYPQRPLLPRDPVRRARDRILAETAGTIHTFFFVLLSKPDAITEGQIAAYVKSLSIIEEELKKRGTKFLSGEQPGYADFAIWPWFERIVLLDLDERIKKFDVLSDYIQRMFQDPVVSQYVIPKDVMVEFFTAYKTGDVTKVNYDLMLDK